MKKLLFLLLFLPFLVSATDVNTCQNLVTADTQYNLIASVYSDATCFNATANNITLDCAGFNVLGNGSAVHNQVYYGVATNSTNLTVKNCFIANFTLGVYADSAPYSNFTNLTVFNNTDAGITISNSNWTRIYSLNSSCYAIQCNVGNGVDYSYDWFGSVSNLFAWHYPNEAFYSYQSFNYSINDSNASIWRFDYWANSNLTNFTSYNYYNATGRYPFTLGADTGAQNIGNNNISDGYVYGFTTNFFVFQALRVYGAVNFNNVTFSTNQTAYEAAVSTYPIQDGGSLNFFNSNVSSGNRSLWILGNILVNFTGSNMESYSADLNTSSVGGGRVVFLNSTLNTTKLSVSGTGVANRSWFTSIRVNYTNGTDTQDVTVLVYNGQNQLVVNSTTNATGYIALVNLTEFNQTSTGKTFLSYHNFSIGNGSLWNFTQVNITQNFVGSSGGDVVINLVGDSSPAFQHQFFNITNSSQYNRSTVRFYANFSDDYNVTNVTLTLNSTNYTDTVVFNGSITNGGWVFNISGLRAGQYDYFYTAMDNASNSNQSQNYSLFITRNSSVNARLFLNQTEANVAYTFPQWINASSLLAIAGESEGNLTLYRNGTGMAYGTTVAESSNQSLAAATYNYTACFPESMNYTAYCVYRYGFLAKNASAFSLFLNNTAADLSGQYYITVNASAQKGVTEGNLTLYRNSTGVAYGVNVAENTNLTGFPPQTFNYTACFPESMNYSALCVQRLFTETQNSTQTARMLLDGSPADESVASGSTTNASGFCDGSTARLYRNTAVPSSVNQSNASWASEVTALADGQHNYYNECEANANFSKVESSIRILTLASGEAPPPVAPPVLPGALGVPGGGGGGGSTPFKMFDVSGEEKVIRLDVTPSRIKENFTVNEKISKTLVIKNTGDLDVFVAVLVNKSWVSVTPQGFDLPVNKSVRIDLRASPVLRDSQANVVFIATATFKNTTANGTVYIVPALFNPAPPSQASLAKAAQSIWVLAAAIILLIAFLTRRELMIALPLGLIGLFFAVLYFAGY